MPNGEFAGFLLAGLFGGVHCPAMCGGFAATCARRRGGLSAWHLGRVTAYALLGALTGSAGALLATSAWIPALVASLLLAWFTLALAGLAPEPRLAIPGLGRVGAAALASPSVPAHFGFGLVNGLLPCGLVYSALALAAAMGGAGRGALGMVLFGLGTVPLLSIGAVALQRILLAGVWQRRLTAVLVFGAGCWTIWARVHVVDPEGARSFLRHCRALLP